MVEGNSNQSVGDMVELDGASYFRKPTNTDFDTNEIIWVGFNQDQSCITVGTQSGFKIYQSDPLIL